MGFFGNLFGSGKPGDPMEKLRRDLSDCNGRKVLLDFDIYAREVLAAKGKDGSLKEVDRDVIAELIVDWKERLESIVNHEVLLEIERLGKRAEFEKVLDTPDIDSDVYLTHVIPNYKMFLMKAVSAAKAKM